MYNIQGCQGLFLVPKRRFFQVSLIQFIWWRSQFHICWRGALRFTSMLNVLSWYVYIFVYSHHEQCQYIFCHPQLATLSIQIQIIDSRSKASRYFWSWVCNILWREREFARLSEKHGFIFAWFDLACYELLLRGKELFLKASTVFSGNTTSLLGFSILPPALTATTQSIPFSHL